ncbi:MAG: hypothetical protein IJ658_12750 [Kiritimatiellae bacterium]|nr:hypothetical protein [Kiritimatiellia bacterium]
MKTDLVQTAFVAISLVLLAALQDMSPSCAGGAKIPLVQVFALYVALSDPPGADERRPRAPRSFRWGWTSAATGYLMEALSGLPPFSCIGFMVPVCALARMLRAIAPRDLSRPLLGMAAAAAYTPLQEAWLAAWSAGGDPAVVRFFVSLVLAALAGAALFQALPAVERFAGLREEEPS